MNIPLQQQTALGDFGAPKRQPSPKHGQKAQAPLSLPPHAWQPRPAR